MERNINILIQRLDQFIRKYYKLQMIRGLVLTLTVFLFMLLLTSISEYFGHFSTTVRTVVFYVSLFLISAILLRFIVIPGLNFFKIGKIISYKQASGIISRHFSNVEDKLLNTLELAQISNPGTVSKELIDASIEQRIEQLHPIPFVKALKYKDALKFLLHFTVLTIVLAIIYFLSPSVLKEGTQRLVFHNTEFVPQAPFRFVLLNDSLSVRKGNDIEIELQIEGDYIPESMYIEFSGNKYLMKKESRSRFSYMFRKLNQSIQFDFNTEIYHSEKYQLQVLPTPVIVDYFVEIIVPPYTGEDNITLKNTGDLIVPSGSEITWKVRTKDINRIDFRFADSILTEAKKDSSWYSVKNTFYRSCGYTIIASNNFFEDEEILRYSISVVPDLHPTVQVNTIHDSLQFSVYYFQGRITDDYGFKNLYFCYRKANSTEIPAKIPMQISPNLLAQEFYYAFDFNQLPEKTDGTLEFYFEVWDNDAVNGSKSARSNIQEFRIPSKEEIAAFEKQASKSIESKIQESMDLAKELKDDINKMRENLINEKTSQWEKSQMMKQIAQKQQSLEQILDQLAKENEQKNEMMNSFSEEEMKLMEKQEQIQDLLENIMDDELKDLIKKFNDLLENFDEKKAKELTEDLEMSYEDMEKQLDRNIELLKKMEMEKNIEKAIDKLDELAEEQEKLSEEASDKKLSDEKQQEMLEKQQEQAKEFEDLKKEYEDIQKQNKELESPMPLEDFKQQMEDVQQEFQQGEQNLQNGKPQKASKNQKQNSDKMKKMSQEMKQMMEQGNAAQAGANMQDLRQIIDNLVKFSFDQEDLMENTKGLNPKDPKFPEYASKQNKLADDFTIIRDSLYSLAKNTPQLNTPITKEIKSIDRNLSKAKSNMEARNAAVSASDQQFIMTSANNLALLLSEVLQAMQQQMAQQMQGDQQCNKPGQGKPSLSQMRSTQQMLKSQLESMIQQMKGKKDGKNGQQFDEKALNKRLAEMLAQQEIFRQSMGKMMKNGNFSPETVRKLDEINRMIQQNEEDIVNKRINPAMLKRQEAIVTRLLEAENSEFQREIDKKRESKEGKVEKISNPEEIFKYKGENSQFNELINSSNLKLNKYYKDRYKEYLIILNEKQNDN